MTASRNDILDAVAKLMHHSFDVTGERDKRFDDISVDLYLPAPLNCIVQFDDARHCTRERALTFASYPADAPLNFDVRRYRADQTAGDEELARQDVAIDLLPAKHGLNPTVRIRYDEITEPLNDCIVSLLAKRFAYHAGTTF